MTIVFKRGSETLHCANGMDIYIENCSRQHLLIYDPPWQIIDEMQMTESDNVLAFCDGATIGRIIDMLGAPTWVFAWDCVSSWWTPNRPLRRMKLCAWYGDISKYNPHGYLAPADMGAPRVVRNTRGEYLYTPKTGRQLSDLYAAPITKLHSAGGAHRHSKPFDWMCALIANTIRPGDVIIDPFAGGGTSLACARLLGAEWIGCEIDAEIASKIDSGANPPINEANSRCGDLFCEA